jgi:DNA-binding NtrC family response regulator
MVVIDDDSDVLDSFINQFSDEFAITGIHWGPDSTLNGMVKSIDEGVAVAVADLKMPRVRGIDLLTRLRRDRPEIVRILLTAYAEEGSSVEAINEADIFYLLAKPLLDEEGARKVFREAGERYLDRKTTTYFKNRARDEATGFDALIGESRKIKEVIARARRVVDKSATVLILGETGTGKELLARAIHYEGPRAGERFEAVNCGLLKDELVESELFGHEKGAFTGAVQQKKGKLEVADGGTVFLDEVGEMSPSIQAKLLRVLETGIFERLGGVKRITVDIRLIAATNRNLEEAMEQGIFREDLYHRLAVFPIVMPPLRERREDIKALTEHLLIEVNRTQKTSIVSISEDALAALQRYHYPGNVRELRNSIVDAAVSANSQQIEWDDLPERIRRADQTAEGVPATGSLYKRRMKECRCKLIAEVLKKHNGNRSKAAEELGITPRYLHPLMKECGPNN